MMVDMTKDLEALARAAMAPVNRDLDRTGYAHLRVAPVDLDATGEHPRYYAEVPGHGAWGGSSHCIEPGMSPSVMEAVAAASASDTLLEVLRVRWPVCTEHGGEPMHLDRSTRWRCGAGHVLAPLGELQAEMVETPA